MKKLSFICIVCLCAALQTNAQLRDTILAKNSFSKDYYLQKSKHLSDIDDFETLGCFFCKRTWINRKEL